MPSYLASMVLKGSGEVAGIGSSMAVLPAGLLAAW